MLAEEFKQAFLEVWEERIETEEAGNQIIAAYQDNRQWTEYMLGADGGMLREVAEVLDREVVCDLNKIDCVYYHHIQGGNNLPAWLVGGPWPVVFDAIIEHENNGNIIQDEWWKLHIYRAPLKVVISYISPNGLPDQLERLTEMAQVARDNWQGPGEDEDEYLVVIGNMPEGELPQWTWRKLVETDNGYDFQDI